jgi:hypothetical protein
MGTEEHRHRAARLTPQLVVGLLIIVAGVLFTLENLGFLYAEDYLRYWPAGLIAIGATKLWQTARDRTGGAFSGVIFVIAGAWLLLDNVRIVHLSFWEAWPMLLVLVGASIVWRGLRQRTADAPAGDSNATISAFAMMAGLNRGNNSKTFRGGEITAIMGGCELDLRQAAIDGEAVIDVFAMWGGIEIRVPEDWTVVGRVNPVLGGYEDKTRPPTGATRHQLVIRGFVIMGGVEVKN